MSQSLGLTQKPAENIRHQERAQDLVAQMTLVEKIGQMSQFNGGGDHLRQLTREGRVGSCSSGAFHRQPGSRGADASGRTDRRLQYR